MKAIDRPFSQIINGTTQFIIPVFQRDYSWTEEQWTQLWDDIIRTAQGNSERGHFIGSVVYVATGDTAAGFTRWLVVDGQQRLTTLTLLLAALRDHINETGWVGDEDGPTAQRIDAYYLKNVQESGSRLPKLVLRRADDETLQSIINGDDLPADFSEAIVEGYELFREFLEETDPDLVYSGIARLIVVDVTLDRHADDPQLVFESLNSTGIDLAQADLIRNFVLMRLPEAEQTDLYERYWSRLELLFEGARPALDNFIRDYLALRTRAIKQTRSDQIYQTFREEFGGLNTEDGGLEETLEDMVRVARYYAAFSLRRGVDGKLKEALWNLSRLVDAPALLVTKLYRNHGDSGSLTTTDFIHSLELIESYILRRAICGLQTRGYWAVFAGIANQIDENTPIQSLLVALARLQDSYRFPSDEEFNRALMDREVYKLRVRLPLLERLENAGSKEPTNTSNYSIEHIMPQNENLPAPWKKMLGTDWQRDHELWLHRLGNLTLTGYNSTYSDRPFEEKKSIPGGFNESSVRLNKFVREQSAWTANEIKARTQLLAKRALQIWPDLVVDPDLIEEAEIHDRRELADRRSVDLVGMSQDARALFDVLRASVLDLGDPIELAETKSVSYHGPHFFLEVLPRKRHLILLLPVAINEVDDPNELAEDAAAWKFIPNAKYDGGTVLYIQEDEDVQSAMSIVRQAFNAAAR